MHTRSLLALSTLLVASVAHAQTWTIPAPEGREHPGAKQAPASSPLTYTDKKGFTQRVGIIVDALANEDLGRWRRGYFEKGGDPGKYLFGPVMAKLIRNPKDEAARQYMNDGRTSRELYHFAAVNWARFLPIFKDSLTEETIKDFASRAGRYTEWVGRGQGGTENHKTMWYTTGAVLPEFLPSDRIGQMPRDAALRDRRDWLRTYVKNLYAAGQGEWDSSTYLMFNINGMLNIYDFTSDDQTRLLAKAALDFYSTAYALKYTDGLFCAPNQRGYYNQRVVSIADQTGWLWWGSSMPINAETASRLGPSFRYAMHAATSSYRPPQVITNIAQRNLPQLPFVSNNVKANYWMGHNTEPKLGAWKESVFVDRNVTMGTLWKGHGGQATRFQLLVRNGTGLANFNGGSPVGRNDGNGSTQRHKYGDGGGMFDVTAQIDAVHVCLSFFPEDEPQKHSFVLYNEAAGEPVWNKDGFYLFTVGDTRVVVVPLEGVRHSITRTELTDRQQADNTKDVEAGKPPRHAGSTILRFDPSEAAPPISGFAVAALTAQQFKDFKPGMLRGQIAKDAKPASASWTWAGKDGWTFTGSAGAAEGRLSGREPPNFEAVYDSPYIQQSKGVLRVHDGKDGFEVDFSGDLPVYRPYKPSSKP